MKMLFKELRAALMLLLVLSAVCCGGYPFLVFMIGQAAFPRQARGSLVRDEQGRVRGSALIGQSFTNALYFHPRPSAAGSGYDAAASGGSNLGPTSRSLRDMIAARITAYRAVNGLSDDAPVPPDAVTASGSGLDTHISVANARLQAGRVAAARSVSGETVWALVAQAVEAPQAGFLGEARVNVLLVNAALDRLNNAR